MNWDDRTTKSRVLGGGHRPPEKAVDTRALGQIECFLLGVAVGIALVVVLIPTIITAGFAL